MYNIEDKISQGVWHLKLAIIGSRSLVNLTDLGDVLPEGVSEIVSGGARGVDSAAAAYAKEHGIKLVEFLPDYEKYGRSAPLVRNQQIVDYADEGLAFWDGVSRGTVHTIKLFKKANKPIRVLISHAAPWDAG